MTIIISQEIRENINDLTSDPIVIDMACDIRLAILDGVEITFGSWEFMSNALAEYNRRGGQNNKTIGAVSNAIELIITGSFNK